MDRGQFIQIVNEAFDLPPLLQQLGVKIYKVPQTLCCPFHSDSRQSAKLFEDGHLYCFAEHRQFGAYDALKYLGFNDAQIRKTLIDKGVKVGTAPRRRPPLDEEKVKILRDLLRQRKIRVREFIERAYDLL